MLNTGVLPCPKGSPTEEWDIKAGTRWWQIQTAGNHPHGKISPIQTDTPHSLNNWTRVFPTVSCFMWATCEFAVTADIFTTQPLILLHKSSMLSQWLQSTSTIADRGMSVSVTIHRDSLICAACGSVTAAKELFLFNADQWTDEERAAWGRPHLRLKHHSALATVAGGVTMPTARTGSVLIRMHLFFKSSFS